jgi:hypothetical protein
MNGGDAHEQEGTRHDLWKCRAPLLHLLCLSHDDLRLVCRVTIVRRSDNTRLIQNLGD